MRFQWSYVFLALSHRYHVRTQAHKLSPHIDNEHPIARQWGRGVRYLIWVLNRIYVLSCHCCGVYILDHAIILWVSTELWKGYMCTNKKPYINVICFYTMISELIYLIVTWWRHMAVHRFWPTLAQVTAPSCYLNQCWLVRANGLTLTRIPSSL